MDIFSRWKKWRRKKSQPEPTTEAPPLRAELLSLEQLEGHAKAIAARHQITTRHAPIDLLPRLVENETILRVYNLSAAVGGKKRPLAPAAEWLLDNFYLIKEQINLVRRHLPRSYHRQLPRLLHGPLAGYPRVYDLVRELISHVDGRVTIEHLSAFVASYQTRSELTIGELWAIPIMLRVALIENLRRIVEQLSRARDERDLAGQWIERMIEITEKNPSDLIIVISDLAKSNPPLTSAFIAEFSRCLQIHGATLQFVRHWLEQRLADHGLNLEELIHSESQLQAADQVSIGNSITSLRAFGAMDWREFVETLSVVEQTLRADPCLVYSEMDFPTRDRYRHVVEKIARQSQLSENKIAHNAIDLSAHADVKTNSRSKHIGYFLVDKGRPILEKRSHVRLPLLERLRRIIQRFPLFFYVGSISFITLGLTAFVLQPDFTDGLRGWQLALFALLPLLCLSHLAVSFVNWLATIFLPPRLLPRMDFADGIPSENRTFVVVPTMLTNLEAIDHLLERLEIHYLANRNSNLFFALLTDFVDAEKSTLPSDEPLLRRAREGVIALNQKYKSDRPNIFFLCHRPRRWNPREGVWMGWERKRGKLVEFNALLRGGPMEKFSDIIGDTFILPTIQHVITLDTDTQLPRDAARQLIGTMAHPLNRPRFDPKKNRVSEGYGILQPRVAISLPSANRSWFVRLFAGEPGIDPYTRAVSDVYQDVFGEGSFIGKGIYDVDAFEKSVDAKFPENKILSHDLVESCYARSALVSDIEIYEEHPSRYIADVSRRHRWIRGDWQIASWLLPRVPGPDARRISNPLSGLSKWKIFDNLRRSLVPVALTTLLLVSWISLSRPKGIWTLFVVLIVLLPGILSALAQSLRKPEDVPWRIYLRTVAGSFSRQFGYALFTLIFLPYDAFVSLDAIVRALVRTLITHRRLLEWQTASEAERNVRSDFRSFLEAMGMVPALALAAGIFLELRAPEELPYSGTLLALWVFSPLIAWWISLPIKPKVAVLSNAQLLFLKKTARKTWRFFETFINDEENWLPPDNFQEHPISVVASRTSPTNIGMSLLSTLAACDFGYITPGQLLERIGKTFHTLDQLERHHGHFYNWYDTRTLKPLFPLYLSSVDSGNFAGHILTLREGILELANEKIGNSNSLHGIEHTLEVLSEIAKIIPARQNAEPSEKIHAAQAQVAAALKNPPIMPATLARALDQFASSAKEISSVAAETAHAEFIWWSGALEQTCRAHRAELESFAPWISLPEIPEALLRAAKIQELGRLNKLSGLLRWLENIPTLREAARFEQTLLPLLNLVIEKLREQDGDSPELDWLKKLREKILDASGHANRRLAELNLTAQRCAEFAEMDFGFLFDEARDLFSIGFNATDHRMDGSFYDLLASEARLTSYLAISQYQVGQEHWFALGRLVVSPNGSPVLVSWSGSMFEYLMPQLVMPSYENTLLDSTCKAAVERQIEYGKERGVPWGFSESGFNLTDAQLNYQYRAFGVPGLGLKRGLSEDLVVAPYASAMALMVAPAEACKNLEQLSREGREGRYGFYEAIDYTPSRLRPGQKSATVRSFMAHHQGMSLVSLAHLLLDRPMQRRFEANALFRSTDLLLQERAPKTITPLAPSELEDAGRPEAEAEKKEMLRAFTNPNAPVPEVHLLSNGRYHVVISTSGSGFSHWKEFAITRWREDTTRDNWGNFCYLRDVESGEIWSSAFQPTLRISKFYEAIFTQGRAEFRRRTDDLDIHTEISVSPEDDIEMRRITLTNRSSRAKTIELTSYAEIALAAQANDLSHPAFSNLFLQTEILREQQAVLCRRRPRSEKETTPWFFHFMLLHGDETGEPSFETDRSKFVGRGRNLSSPQALENSGPLSNSEGSVLDPMVSIRRTIKLAPEETALVDLIFGVSETRDGALGLLQKYRDPNLTNRVLELAWTHSQVILHHLNATEVDAQLFGRLATSLIYANRFRRAPSAILQKNSRGQTGLWAYGISGDLPITLVFLSQANEMNFARQIVQAHAYWRMKGLQSDLVILTEEDSVYRAGLHEQVIGLIASSTEAALLDRPGGIFARRLDQISEEDKILLQTVARIILSDKEGTLAEQIARRPRPEPFVPQLIPTRQDVIDISPPEKISRGNLIFDNGYGGFSPDGKEYVTILEPGQVTPAPWANVLANATFGTLVSESGGAYTWAENAHEFRLTPWNNDPVSDTSGEAFYIRDEQTGKFWSPTPLPARGQTAYKIRHGFGYSIFEHTENGIQSELTIFVAVDAPVKFASLKLKNISNRDRRVSATGFWEWVLGELRQKNAPYVVTEIDPRSGALLARNSFNQDFSSRVAFVDVQVPTRTFTADRTEFLGRNGSAANPAALHRLRLSGKTGAGFDPCAALQVNFELAEGQEREIIFRLGVGRDAGEAQQLIHRFRGIDATRRAFDAVKNYWKHTLGAIQVETPDPAFDVLANGWLIYQTLSCRMWARTGFYQSGGAFGFRDQLQDAMALIQAEPRLLREHLLRAAAHQFGEGDVQHWWHPPTDRGVRTHFSDDYLWLPYATCRYVLMLNDTGVLDEMIPFLEGRPLRPDEESYYDLPHRSSASGTLYEHCVRAINYGLKFGAHGLPLIGCGDWNDGMNLIGEHGKGESVWLAFFLYDVLTQFAEVARKRNDDAFARHCTTHAARLRENIEKFSWDGEWYLRAYFDDGTPLGSAQNPECKIDSLPQSWAIISRAGDVQRARLAMESVNKFLVRRDAKLIQLFTPPFDKSPLNPGYIKGYVPGVRENGGQYTHAAIWTTLAFALLGENQRAWKLFSMINPINHSRDRALADVYKVEPYVVAADVYAVSPHTGRGGWTWYTGSAGWMYQLAIENLLGLKLEIDQLRFAPCLPPEWKSFKVRYRFRETFYHIVLEGETGFERVKKINLDGVDQSGETIPLRDDRKEHHVKILF